MRHGPEGAGRILRNPAERGLQAEHAGERARHADGAAPVRPQRQRPHARRHRRGRAAAASAGGEVRVPGVAGDAGERTVGHCLPVELRGIRLSEQHRSLLAQTCHRRGVDVPRSRLRGERRAPAGRPSHRQKDILDRGGNSVHESQRFAPPPASLRLPRLGQSTFGVDQPVGIQALVQRGDSGQCRFGRLDRGARPGPVECQQLGCRASREVRRRHVSPRAAARTVRPSSRFRVPGCLTLARPGCERKTGPRITGPRSRAMTDGQGTGTRRCRQVAASHRRSSIGGTWSVVSDRSDTGRRWRREASEGRIHDSPTSHSDTGDAASCGRFGRDGAGFAPARSRFVRLSLRKNLCQPLGRSSCGRT